LAPAIPRGLLADRFDAAGWPEIASPVRRLAYRWMLAAPFAWPSFVAYDVNALPASPPLALRHFFHLPLLTWTVRTPEQRAIAKEWADQVIFEGFDPEVR
jgi:glycerophosphoryl diester phosphodiesterase